MVSTSVPAIVMVMVPKVSLGSKSKIKVSPIMARDESLEFVEIKETVFNVGLVPSNQTNEPSLVSVTSPVELQAESSMVIEKFINPSSPSSINSRTAMNSSPFSLGTTFEPAIRTCKLLCASDAVKNNEIDIIINTYCKCFFSIQVS